MRYLWKSLGSATPPIDPFVSDSKQPLSKSLRALPTSGGTCLVGLEGDKHMMIQNMIQSMDLPKLVVFYFA